jgi:hypothetical protein
MLKWSEKDLLRKHFSTESKGRKEANYADMGGKRFLIKRINKGKRF